MKKCIIPISGGYDSTLCLLWALKNNYDPYCIFFNYGQRNLKQEFDMTQSTCRKYKVPLECIDLKNIKMKSNLIFGIKKQYKINKNTYFIPDYTPLRNSIFYLICHQKAFEYQIKTILVMSLFFKNHNFKQYYKMSYPDTFYLTIKMLQYSLYATSAYFVRIKPIMITKVKNQWKRYKIAKKLGDEAFNYLLYNTMSDDQGDYTLNYWGFGDIKNDSSKGRKEMYDLYLKYVKK